MDRSRDNGYPYYLLDISMKHPGPAMMKVLQEALNGKIYIFIHWNHLQHKVQSTLATEAVVEGQG